MNKLPQMAKQLEVSLYRNAPSFEAYTNMDTLRQRLHQIAQEVSRKTRTQGGSSSAPASDQSDRQYFDRSQQQQPPQNTQYRQPSPYMQNGSNNSSAMPPRMSNDMGTMSSHTQGSLNQGNGGTVQPSSNRGMSTMINSARAPTVDDPDVRVRIRHKQQRLLLLHHSAKCPHEDGRCTVTPHCADMKRLWRHMEGCRDNNCRVAHCFSSRAILSHYRKCRDMNCPACGPVRETVRRNRGTSTSRPGASTGPMMNSIRESMMQPPPPQPSSLPVPQQQQRQPPLPSACDSSMTAGSTNTAYMSSPSSQRSRDAMPPPQVSQPTQESQYSQPSQFSTSSTTSSNYRSAQNSMNDDSLSILPSTSSSSRPNDNISGPSRPDGENRNDAEYQRIRHKQQRLLLLRHATRCQHPEGTCPVTPHCASMKRLWEHIAHCRDANCTVQHCLSSRYVLAHYRRCRDPRCPACGPVRETIRRSSQRDGGRRGDRSFDNPAGSDPLISAPGLDTTLSSIPDQPSPSYEREPKRSKPSTPVPEPSVPSLEPSIPGTVVSSVEGGTQPAAVTKPESGKTSDTKDPSKGSADHSLLNSFTVKQLETHLASLDRKTQLPPAKLKTKCLEVLKGLQTHQHGWVFNCPVDPVELGLPDYFDIIKKPMDLGTIQKRLENGSYHSIEEFSADVYLTFDNAMTYNEKGSVVYDMAKELKVKSTKDLQKMMTQLEAEDLQRRQNERACTLCGCEKLLFEPPVYFCNGMNCQSQRIRRNSHFYIGGNNQYYWCSTCYNELDEKIPIELIDMTIVKGDLIKKKNDEVHEESWVQCDSCERWVHQICGLFNSRQNKEHHSEYYCPRCLLDKRKTTDITPGMKPLSAADLPRTTLSEWLEQSITKKVEQRKRELAEEKAQTEVSDLINFFCY